MKKNLFFFLLLHQVAFAQPLQLLPENPHYFSYQGKPTVIVGSGEHYGALMNLDFDFENYLNAIHKDGLNTTRLFMGAYYELPGAFGIEKNTLAPKPDKLLLPWTKVNDKFDLNNWNEAYFTRLAALMQQAQKLGIIVEITLFSSYYGAGWAYHPFNGNNNSNDTPTNLVHSKVNTLENGNILVFQEKYVKKLVAVLNVFDNFYFEIQNEPWADSKDALLVWNDYIQAEDLKISGNNWRNMLEVPSAASQAWHQKVADWIIETEKGLPKRHLISHNISNFKQPITNNNPNISIFTFHYAHPEVVAMNYEINKPIGFNETGFAGRSDATYRRQAWRFMMSGGSLFNHLDYSYTVDSETGTDTTNNAPGGGSPALRQQFNVLKKVLAQFDLKTLHPEKDFLGHIEGAFAYSMRDATKFVVYLEPLSEKLVLVRLKLPKGTYQLTWMNAITGETVKKERLKTVSTIKNPLLLTSPANLDEKVLLLERQ